MMAAKWERSPHSLCSWVALIRRLRGWKQSHSSVWPHSLLSFVTDDLKNYQQNTFLGPREPSVAITKVYQPCWESHNHETSGRSHFSPRAVALAGNSWVVTLTFSLCKGTTWMSPSCLTVFILPSQEHHQSQILLGYFFQNC